MTAAGILHEESRVELIAGEIVTKMSIGPTHAAAINRLVRLLSSLAGTRCILAVQNPVALDEFSEPEPDVALLAPRADFYARGHPQAGEVLLLIEVADSSLAFDRDRKIPLYAAAGIPEAWLIDLNDRSLTIFRQPAGRNYLEIFRPADDESIPLPGLPGLQIGWRELLP